MKLNTHIYQAVVTALCALSLSPALVFAGGTPKPLNESGIIKSVDTKTHMLVVTEHKNHVAQKFQWNDQTKFSERDKSASASALKEGERVRLTYTTGGGTPTLQAVHIAPLKTEKHSARNTSRATTKGA